MKRILAGLLLIAAAPAPPSPPPPPSVATLARDVDDVAAIGAIKRLQIAYTQYAELGLWSEMADLFADKGEAVLGDRTIQGRDAIHRYFLTEYGGGREGLPIGGVRYQLPLTPVVNIGADGHTAKGRWHELAMLGRVGGDASWTGGIYENDYVEEGGVWKIARLHYYPQFAGPYATGWRNLEHDLKVVPYHYTPEQAGIPIPPRTGAGGGSATTLAALDSRLDRMADEQAVRNLQNIYGYYVDRRMWDDVADLFDRDAVETVEGLGSWIGPASIRRGLERDGPPGLKAGDLNEHVQVDMIVTVSPDGRAARARGLELGLIGTNSGKGYWTVAVFENRYARRDGVWRIAEVHLFPRLKSDYALGWGKSAIVDPPLAAAFAPDRPAAPLAAGTVPGFSYPNPVTGRPVRFPEETPVASPGAGWARGAAAKGAPASLEAAEAKLRRLAAYEGAENVSSAFGNYIDDFNWRNLGQLFAAKGAREMPYAGFFIGPDRITTAETTKWGPPRSPRTSIPIHLRIQPVIDVAADGRSANIRTRLFSIGSSFDRAGMFSGGMYPNDQAVLEKGVWKLWSVAIDEYTYQSATYADGWVNVPADPAEHKPDPLLSAYPPDIPLTTLGKREQGFIPGSTMFNPYVFNGPAYPGYPSANPMWFGYRNPVSGRVPPYYWPDCVTCVVRPETSLKANGY